MGRKPKYKKYDLAVKTAISETGRPDLFPEMAIPRMTALYWIKQGFESRDPVLGGLTRAMNDLQRERDENFAQVREQRALMWLLHEVFQILGFKIRWKHIDSGEAKAKLLKTIELAMEAAGRDRCLEEIGLSLSRYKRWRRERRICGFTGQTPCPKWVANQLTQDEVKKMREFVTSKEFAHFPIRSLHYYAKREGSLFCSYSTWRKYIDQYNWKRPRRVYPKISRKIGIRAQHPNEIWHLDVTYFILPDKTKLFIQPIIDNYSRFVIAWQVLDSYDGSKTAALIQRALTRVATMRGKEGALRLIVDGGGENKSKEVTRLQGVGNFLRQVARFEISSSNAMVETLFRSMKHNYLFHQTITNIRCLTRHTNFWFHEHNERIPHTAFEGETPLERFNQTWNKDCEIRILVRHEEAVKLRIKENQKIFCDDCEAA